MDVDLRIETPDLEELVGGLDHFIEDQLPFALSLAMNRAAKDAVQRGRSSLGKVFDLRSRSLAGTFGPSGRMGDTSRGWSSKKQWPDLFVDLHSKAPAMAMQEAGGIKPERAPKVWIATKHVPRSASTGRKQQKYQPARLRKKMSAVRQRGSRVVFQQGGTVFERTKATGEVRPLYLIRRRARVRPALGFEQVVSRTFAAKLTPRFSQAMAKAERTRRT